MNKKLREIYKNNKYIVWAAVVALILSLAVLVKVKDEVTRFTLIMPVFDGFILFSILITPDEELEDKEPSAAGHTPARHAKTRKDK